MAYIDQLIRAGDVDFRIATDISKKLEEVRIALENGGDRRLGEQINALERSLKESGAGKLAQIRMQKLKYILKEIGRTLM